MPYDIEGEYPTIQKTDLAVRIAGRNYVLKTLGVFTLIGNVRAGSYLTNDQTGEKYITMTEIIPGQFTADLKDLKIYSSEIKGRDIDKKDIGKVYPHDPDRMDRSAELAWKRRTGQSISLAEKNYGNSVNIPKSGYVPDVI